MKPAYPTPNLRKLIPTTQNFYWSEALYCFRWDVYVIPTLEIHENIVKTARVMQRIRSYFRRPIVVTSWYRPPEYNDLIQGSPKSAHMKGLACDFVVSGVPAYKVQEELLHLIDEWEIRMEDNGKDASWTHIDLYKPKPNRYFKP